MTPMLNPNDHDLLIVISEGQRELKQDVRAMSDALRELKAALDQTNERQRDQDNRLVNLTNTVVRLQTDQRDDHTELAALKAEHTRWKLYMRVALILMTPIYLIMLALIIEWAKTQLLH